MMVRAEAFIAVESPAIRTELEKTDNARIDGDPLGVQTSP